MPEPVADACTIFHEAVRSVQADRLLEDVLWQRSLRRAVEDYRRIVVVGMGKAAMAMAGVVERQIGRPVTDGLVVVPEGYTRTLPGFLPRPLRIEVVEGGHPLPTRASVRAARRILQAALQCGEDDLLLVLISGGGTALCADFVEGVSLDNARNTFRLLLEAGADIHAMNTVRKHISGVSGGRLAEAAAPAETLALVVSDVVGDDLSVIASGPTVPDASTFAQAVQVLVDFDLLERVPRSVRAHLEAGCRDVSLETPKPDLTLFAHTRTELIGSNRTALAAAAARARDLGYAVYLLSDCITGEARTIGRQQAEVARGLLNEHPICLLWGGETTVTVRGTGRGGRNQELALAASLALEGCRRPVVFLSGGTDGRDGPTDAAGAWVTERTARAARNAGLMPELFLARNDAYPFFEKARSLLATGPTHTNVMDLQIALVRST
ncbi:MAG TPA: DUF4147 domain-containing protein [Rhodothermales bacterium]|nr:DUF4147 domain-containing protein [Rhodothermales bacterium]